MVLDLIQHEYMHLTLSRRRPLPYRNQSIDLLCKERTSVKKEFKKQEKFLISKGILFKKTALMYVKGEFSKIKGSICNIPLTLQIYGIFYQGQQFPMD